MRDDSADDQPVEGTGRIIPTPLRVEARQDRLKRWLRTGPISAGLLAEYPYAIVIFADEPA